MMEDAVVWLWMRTSSNSHELVTRLQRVNFHGLAKCHPPLVKQTMRASPNPTLVPWQTERVLRVIVDFQFTPF